ncbi:Z1 domain-containing protein [Paenibacillus sp. FSL R7-0312]|uniref:Z1 domain-containing protein n=1 Tax=Paenibacillus sp. FSL R7-0312 TaxID=2921682 RepID=UPI0030FB0C31
MLKTIQTGIFYNTLKEKNGYDEPLETCIKETVAKLQENNTSANRPGMLLGKIQSGKTRTFIGIMGLAYDNDFDVTIILTKGTIALAQQTIERLNSEFHELIQNDKMQVFDIMNVPSGLRGYVLNQKLVFVVKKEKRNMERLHNAFFEKYPLLGEKRILIIDDEADYASLGFNKSKAEGLEIKKIAGSIDEFRKKAGKCDFLQVTATPYSLYLQPEELTIESKKLEFKPIRPAFTKLVPIHNRYIGGDFYFDQNDDGSDSISNHLFEEVNESELEALKKSDRRSFKIEDCLISPKVKTLREAIVNFIVGGSIRRLQNRELNEVEKKFSFIIHTEQNKSSHGWQDDVILAICDKLNEECKADMPRYNELIEEAYDNLKESIDLYHLEIPTIESVKKEVRKAFLDEHIMTMVVNSEKEVKELLDETGQLKLRTPLNIFIGGQILDRGITIGNLIGFYYGRRPKTFQQDTVLQHSRMFGARPMEDLIVTRFYTTKPIYDIMKKIHDFDTALREAFERGNQNNGVIFIQKDTKDKIVPCSPNKLLLSSITTLKPSSRLLPVGFEVKAKTNIQKAITQIDKMLENRTNNYNEPFLMNLDEVIEMAKLIESTFKEGHNWDLKAFISSLEFLSNRSTTLEERQGKVWILVRKERQAQRLKQNDGRLENSPDSYQEKNKARDVAQDIPALVLLRQEGEVEKGWSGHPFWWPVLVTPADTRTAVFTSEEVSD